MNEILTTPAIQMLDDGPGATAVAVDPARPASGDTRPVDGAGASRHAPVVIIGAGPAGLTAAIYAARANLSPIVLGGREAGGQLMLTSDVENYPGFPEGIQGPELIAKFREQAERFGAQLVDADVEQTDFSTRPFRILAGGVSYTADAVIVATGASALWLGLENETRLRGRGVSACATCDGFFFRDKRVVVVGGGDTALEEALFLTRFASEVLVVHRRDQFRCSKIMEQRAFDHPKITVHWNTEVVDILGDELVRGVRLRDTQTGEERDEPADGLFVAIGHRPNTDVVRDQLEVDAKGFLVVERHTRSKIEGVFIAGDVHDHDYRQAVTAAADGCKAAIDAERWLETQARPSVADSASLGAAAPSAS